MNSAGVLPATTVGCASHTNNWFAITKLPLYSIDLPNVYGVRDDSTNHTINYVLLGTSDRYVQPADNLQADVSDNDTVETLTAEHRLLFGDSSDVDYRLSSWYQLAVQRQGKVVYGPVEHAYDTIPPSVYNLGLTISKAVDVQNDSVSENVTVGGVCLIALAVATLHSPLNALSYGAHGMSFILQRDGVLIAASDSAVDAMITIAQAPIQATTSSYNLIRQVGQAVQRLGLIDSTYVLDPTQAPLYPDSFVPPVVAADITVHGRQYQLQAQILPISGVEWVTAVIMDPSDFDGPLHSALTLAAWLSVVIVVSAVVVTLLLVHVITRPILTTADFMGDLETLLRRAALESEQVVRSGMVGSDPPPQGGDLKDPSGGFLVKPWPQEQVAVGADLPSRDPRTVAVPSAQMPLSEECGRLGEKFALVSGVVAGGHRPAGQRRYTIVYEVAAIQAAFRSVTHALKASFEHSDHATEARRHFVRYIFHEVSL